MFAVVSPPQSPSAAGPARISRGGFSGMPGARMTTTRGDAETSASPIAVAARARRAAADEFQLHHPGQSRHDVDAAARVARVPFDGWAKEKEARVRTAFQRIIEKGWYDKHEQSLNAAEQVHVNAVREHYAMRRDKLKTPDWRAAPGGNTWTRLEWAGNMEAIDALAPTTSVQAGFKRMLQRQARHSSGPVRDWSKTDFFSKEPPWADAQPQPRPQRRPEADAVPE